MSALGRSGDPTNCYGSPILDEAPTIWGQPHAPATLTVPGPGSAFPPRCGVDDSTARS
jgi:hypothetical protein